MYNFHCPFSAIPGRNFFRSANNTYLSSSFIVVDAYAGWCGPCNAIVNIFRKIKNETGDDLLNYALVSQIIINIIILRTNDNHSTEQRVWD